MCIQILSGFSIHAFPETVDGACMELYKNKYVYIHMYAEITPVISVISPMVFNLLPQISHSVITNYE